MIMFLDFETYYDKEYSLKKLTPPEYILDERFEMILCAVKEDDGAPYIVDGPDFAEWTKRYDWSKITTITYNALFDNCILAWRYNASPGRVLCAMRLAAATRGHELRSYSLASVAEYLGVGRKGTEIENVQGRTREHIIESGLWEKFQRYAINDVILCAAISDKLLPELPLSERRIMDQVLRCAVEPKFVVDTKLLTEHMQDLETAKQALLSKVNATPMELRSTHKFAKILVDMGIEIELKQSKTDPDKKIPAFAATDGFMQDLLNHEDPAVQALAAARLNMRSTIEEKRAEKILKIASLKWPGYCGGNMPFPLRYSGAHTHRLSGDWGVNMQNLPSGRGGKTSKLRKSLCAPAGYKVITADLAQIEARITAWICGQKDLLAQFRDGLDPYSILGGSVFGYPVNKNDHPVERFIGKTGVLGLGFGCGVERFFNMVLQSSRTMGLDLSQVWTRALATRTVDIYRQKNMFITRAWHHLDGLLMTAWMNPACDPIRWGPVEIGHGYVKGPTDLKMLYKTVNGVPKYTYGKTEHYIYGAKFLENIVQFLARIVVMCAGLRIADRGYRFAGQSHDELIFVVPDSELDNAKKIIYEEMTRPPSWAKELPLGCEIGVGQSYGEAK